MLITQTKKFTPPSRTSKVLPAAENPQPALPTDKLAPSASFDPSTKAQSLRVTLPPRRDDIVLSKLDLPTALAERNAEGIAKHMKGDSVTLVAKEVSRVGARLNDKIEKIISHLPDSAIKVKFVSQALSISGRMAMPPVMSMANALTPKEQQAVLEGSDSQGFLRSCGFGKVDGPKPKKEAKSEPTPLLDTPSGRPEVDARIRLAQELNFSFVEKDNKLQVSDPQGRLLSDDAGPLSFPTGRQEWPSTACRVYCALESATHTIAEETGLPATVQTLLKNARSAKMFHRLTGLGEQEGKMAAAQLAQLKSEVPNSQVPRLTVSDFDLVEPPNSRYNCFAHTVGVTDRRIDREIMVNGKMPLLPEVDGLYRGYGFAAKHSDSLQPEAGVEKVLVYGKGETPTHVALLKEDGYIYSKLGSGALIRHRRPEVLFGPTYGEEIIGCYQRARL